MNKEEFETCYTPEPFSGCWLWMRSVNNYGYGTVNRKNLHDRAHRISWRIFRGEIPAGMCVLHTCDVRACVNPAHLFIGTNADNMRDRDAKGRGKCGRGERNSHAKLTQYQASEIRQSRENYGALAERYGVTRSHIGKIVRGQRWTYEAAQ